jgi:hypothetical protein
MAWMPRYAGFDSLEPPDLINAHKPHYAVLAARLSGLTKVEEYPWGSVDTVACRMRGADQPEEPDVLEGPLTDRLLQPGVVTAGSHLEHSAHCSNVKAIAVGLYKFVGLTDLPVLAFARIGTPPRR